MTPNEEAWRMVLCIALACGFLGVVLNRAFPKETYYKIMTVIFCIFFVLECTVWQEYTNWFNRIMMLLLAYGQYLGLRKTRSSSR